jgi:hypothetical protein
MLITGKRFLVIKIKTNPKKKRKITNNASVVEWVDTQQ